MQISRTSSSGSTGHRSRRIVAPVLAVSALVAALGAGSAQAGDDQLWLSSNPYELALTGPAEDGTAAERTLSLLVSHDISDNVVPAGKLTVDVAELTPFAEVRWPANCAPETATRAVCDFPGLTGFQPVTAAEIGVRALPGAAEGDTGYVRYTAEAGAMTAYPGETRVTIGNGPDLAFSQAPDQRGVRPGSALSVPATLTNNGNRGVDRTILQLFASRGLKSVGQHGNCEYQDTVVGVRALCVLNEPVAPGQSYTLDNPMTVGRNALYERYDYSVEPYSDEALEAARAGQTYVKGSGPDLNLRPAPALRSAALPDLDPSDNSRSVTIEAKNTADYKLVGSQVSGAPGQTVDASVTVRNRGPAWVASIGAGDPVATVDIRVPLGTTVVGLPDSCQARTAEGDWRPERLGAPRYQCETEIYLHERGSHSFDFKLRVDQVIPASKGAAAIVETLYPPIRSFDPDLTNNSARIVVNG